ncbi:hypothetical protein CV189_24775, partial [Salmonella enterica]|nr:hypothetical protein [Salmonella enterica]
IIAQNITAQNGGNWPVSLASSGFHIAQNSAHPDPQRSAPAENCAEKSCADDTQKKYAIWYADNTQNPRTAWLNRWCAVGLIYRFI